MNRFLLFLALLGAGQIVHAQYVYAIKADSVKITNSCDTAELIIENHTQTVPGFLFNKGRGRTEFRRLLQNVNENTFLIGGDTLNLSNFWMQGGNSFGATGLLGTKDNYPLTFLQNGVERGRIETSGNWLFNKTQDKAGYLAQFNGAIWTSGHILFESNINLICQNGVTGNSRVSIGTNNNVAGDGAIAMGKDMIVNGGFGLGRSNTVTNGIGIFGNSDGGIAVGFDSYAGAYSIAIGHKTASTDVCQFVSGGVNSGGTDPITDIYFGTGVQRNNFPGRGFGYTIHGSGAYGANEAGGDITIAGGKGTGAGKPGSIIFATAQPTSGTTLQGLSEKARFDSIGNFGIGTSTPSAMLHVSGTSRFDNSITTSGHKSAIRNTSSNITIGDTDEYVFVNAGSGAVTVTLPNAAGRDGQTYTIKKIDNSNVVNVTNASSQLIDGANSYPLTSQWQFITVVANNGSWMVVSKN